MIVVANCIIFFNNLFKSLYYFSGIGLIATEDHDLLSQTNYQKQFFYSGAWLLISKFVTRGYKTGLLRKFF